MNEPIRIRIAHETPERLHALEQVLAPLGYEVSVDGDPTDLVLVGRHGGDAEALALVGEVVNDGSHPVVVLLEEHDPDFVAEAAARGAFAYVVGLESDPLRGAIEIARGRYVQYRGLQVAFQRRAAVERAKGILMARHAIDEDAAFELLRSHARNHSRRVVDVAEAVVESQRLLASENGAGG
jgi:response regulator NasT